MAHELSLRLPDNCILTADSGSSTNWWARQVKLRKGMRSSLSGNLATMGPAAPYSIAAKFAHPEKPVIAFIGDGAFQMNGMNELITVKRYWERWENPSLVWCVFNNQDLNQVTWEQRVLTGDPKYPGTQWIPEIPYARYAELLGFEGIYCDNPAEMGDAWDRALKASRPCPPMAPHVTTVMAKKSVKAMAAGDPEAAGVMEKSIRSKFQEIKEKLPGRDG